ncbi:hypothetical protein ES708_27154 [subsurface metagenome]
MDDVPEGSNVLIDDGDIELKVVVKQLMGNMLFARLKL